MMIGGLVPGVRQPAELFKNLSLDDLAAFTRGGRLSIGTTASYRESAPPFGDATEGEKCVEIRPSEAIELPEAEFERLIPSSITIQGGNILFSPGSTVDIGVTLPDVYLFCTSEVRLPAFGWGWYRIVHPLAFGWTLFSALRRLRPGVTAWSLAPVRYGSFPRARTRHELHRLGDPRINEAFLADYLRKPLSCTYQLEWRYVFFTDTSPIDRLRIVCPDLRAYCRW